MSATDIYTLEYIQIISGSHIIPTVTVGLKRNGEIYQEAANGNSSVDAAYKAIERVTGVTAELTDYDIKAVNQVGKVTVKIMGNGGVAIGCGASIDFTEASARAYVNALNKLLS